MFARTKERDIIESALRSVPVGETVSRASLAKAAGIPESKAQGFIYGAMRSLFNDGIHFRTIRGKGEWERIDDAGKVDQAGVKIRALGRQARRQVRGLKTVDIGALPHDKRTECVARMATAGAMTLLTEKPAQRKLAKHLEVTNGELPNMNATLELLKD